MPVYQYCLLQTTCSDLQEAEKIVASILEKKLAACVQISAPVTSHYRWEGALRADKEFVLSMKTRRDKIEAIEKLLHTLHSYDIPEVITTALDYVSPRYRSWMEREIN